MTFDIVNDLIDQFLFGMPDTALDHVAGKDTEPDLDLIQPGSIGRREVKGNSSMLGNPLFNLLMFMRAEVVENDMEMPAGILAVEVFKKSEKLLVPMPVDASSLHASVMYGESSQQAGRAVPLVGRRQSLGLTDPQGEHRLSAIQSLNL